MSKEFLSRALTHILMTVATTIAVDVARDEIHRAMLEYSTQKNKNPIGFVPNE